VFAIELTAEWAAWVAALSAPLHRRCRWRLAPVVAGILTASGRRTASSGWRAAGIGSAYRSYSDFLDGVGRKATQVASVLVGLTARHVDPDGRWLLVLDDSPTKRYGPEVQGAGIHHTPTPGPAGAKFLFGHSGVTLGRIVRHRGSGAIGLPLLGRLYIRRKDLPKLPDEVDWEFRTKPRIAAGLITRAGSLLGEPAERPWVVVDGGYANREFLKPAMQAGFTAVARLRRDAKLNDLPPPPKPGQKRGRGRPPIYGKDRLSLAKRAGHRQGWQDVRVKTNTGREEVRSVKTLLATWRPAGGVIRVAILREEDGSWRAFLWTDPEASVEAIVQASLDRWAVEQTFHDVKEVGGAEQVQSRRVWSNVGAWDLNLWVHCLVEVWGWGRPAEQLSDRTDRPWDDAERRPSHADRRKALQREMIEEEYRRISIPGPWSQKIRPLLEGVVRMVA
jgi:hypothetical protein